MLGPALRLGTGLARRTLGSRVLGGLKGVGGAIASTAVATKVASKIGAAGPAAGRIALGGAAFGAGAAGVEQLLAGGGVIEGGARRRGKGITASEMRGYWKVCRVLGSMGMKPKIGGRRRSKRCR